MYKEIETKNGIYKIKMPTGSDAAAHFAIISRALPKNSETDKDGNVIMSTADEDRLYSGFEKWVNRILKKSVGSDSVYKFEEMPGEDQWIIFMAMISLIDVDGEELFRFI